MKTKPEFSESDIVYDDLLLLMNSIQDYAIIRLDAKGTITSWNKGAELIKGYTRNEAIGKNFSIFYPQEDITAGLPETNLNFAKKNGSFAEKGRRIRKDGSVFWADMVLTALYADDGSVRGFVKITRDITQQREQSLEFERLQLQVNQAISDKLDSTLKEKAVAAKNALEEKNIILESIGDAFFAVDKHWIVTYWNKMAEKVLGRAKEEMIGNNLWEIYSDAIGSLSYKSYHRAIEINEAMHFEDYYAPLNKWYEISAYPTGNGLSIYFKDVTDRKISDSRLKELNESLSKHAQELAVSNTELEQFAYVASHDLQEPLRMITGFLTQIEQKYESLLDDNGKKYIHFAVDGAKRMRQIILDLLEFSRVGRAAHSTEVVGLNNLVNNILLLYGKQIEETGATITIDTLPTIKTNKVPVRQVFQNLISNALKYIKPDVSPRIHIRCKEEEELYQFSITDNGIGIHPEYFEKIFVIFQRLHNKDEYSGTGMGLAVTKKIIESQGGKIWVESEVGKGSAFYFTILKNIDYEADTHFIN